jgi:hypothetical protein
VLKILTGHSWILTTVEKCHRSNCQLKLFCYATFFTVPICFQMTASSSISTASLKNIASIDLFTTNERTNERITFPHLLTRNVKSGNVTKLIFFFRIEIRAVGGSCLDRGHEVNDEDEADLRLTWKKKSALCSVSVFWNSFFFSFFGYRDAENRRTKYRKISFGFHKKGIFGTWPKKLFVFYIFTLRVVGFRLSRAFGILS